MVLGQSSRCLRAPLAVPGSGSSSGSGSGSGSSPSRPHSPGPTVRRARVTPPYFLIGFTAQPRSVQRPLSPPANPGLGLRGMLRPSALAGDGAGGLGGTPAGAASGPHLLGAWGSRRAPGALHRAALPQGSHLGAGRRKGNRCLGVSQGALSCPDRRHPPPGWWSLPSELGAGGGQPMALGAIIHPCLHSAPGRACAAVMGAQGSCRAGGCSHPFPMAGLQGTAAAQGNGTGSSCGVGLRPAPGELRLSRGHPRAAGGGSGWPWRCDRVLLAPASQAFSFHHREETGPCLHLGWAAPALSGWTRTGALLLRAPGCFSLIQQDLSQFDCPSACWRLTSLTGNQLNQRHSPSPCQLSWSGLWWGLFWGWSPLIWSWC